MRWSERFATGLVPLMARALLCAALLPLGWQKVFTLTAFSATDTATLNRIGLGDDGLDWSRVQATGPSWQSASPETLAAAPATTSQGPLTARSLYRIALVCDAGGVPFPAIAAWLVALTELVGSLMLIAGFFARRAAFAVACIMGGAIWMTSLPALRANGWWSLPMDDYLRLWTQCGLMMLALVVLLSGAGWLTVDGALGQGGTRSGAQGRRADASATKGRSKGQD